MAINYTPATNFGAKDSLPTNDPDKVIKGVDFTNEFNAIKSAFTLAAPAASPTFTGTATFADSLAVDTDTLFVDSTTSRVGIENAAPNYTLEVTGEAVATQGMPYIAEGGTSRTLAFSDIGNYIRFTNAAATTVTIPPNSSVAIPTGAEVILFQAGTGQVTIAAGAGVTLNSKAGNLKISAQYAGATCKKVATDTWDVIGDLSA